MKETERTILAIDLKSFYASVECVDRGLDPFNTPLVVCDKERGKGTIILAVSPYAKTLGIPSRLRLYELPKVKNMIYAKPRMERYIKKSLEVLGVYLKFVSRLDMHVYSIDEAFLDITHYLKASGKCKEEFAQDIIDCVYQTTHLTVTAGIGSNLLMAKLAMDIEAKHNKNFMATWTKEDIPLKLWPLTPLSKMWGIGDRMQGKLNDLGMYTVGDIAISDPKYLQKIFGIIGLQIWEHANGIDDSLIQEPYVSQSNSLSVGQTLFSDYDREATLLILKENVDELIVRLHHQKYLAGSISISVGYSSHGGFSKHSRLAQPTDNYQIILCSIERLFNTNYNPQKLVRSVCIAAGDLSSNEYEQFTLFVDPEKELIQKKYEQTIENIREIYGKNSLYRASALMEKSNYIRRSNQIGGHRK
jgi:DNA polymerase V